MLKFWTPCSGNDMGRADVDSDIFTEQFNYFEETEYTLGVF